jgi:hypothetical protein
VTKNSDLAGSVCAYLKGLPGVKAAVPVADGDRPIVQELETRYECQAFVPLRNFGLREVLARDETIVLLKDRQFRPPPGPTLYMVEGSPDGGPVSSPPDDDIALSAGGVRWRVIGEERIHLRSTSRERILELSDTFVFYPDRRTSPGTPSFFLLPALPFPELESWNPSLRSIVSISPSSTTDVFLRERCGLPDDGNMATLLIGYNRTDPVGLKMLPRE